jgi:uncharacterized membrane protein
MIVVGVIAGVAVGAAGYWQYSAVVGWAIACVVYVGWVWAVVGGMDPEQTSTHATREQLTRRTGDLLLLCASVASLVALIFVMTQAKVAHGSGKDVLAALAVASVALSWFLIHTLFTLRYAELYYTGTDGGIDFNQSGNPSYADFAYLAFTIGMTFQVSDTNLRSSAVRATALRHGLLSYLFGSVILATTVNLIAGLAG